MRFKLDENIDPGLVPLLEQSGHDADTVLGEKLSGHSDIDVYEACLRGGRALITLDLDFANPIRFPPGPTEGLIVIRPPRPVLSLIRSTLVSLLPELQTRPLNGSLWIAEPGRIRVYRPQEEDERPPSAP